MKGGFCLLINDRRVLVDIIRQVNFRLDNVIKRKGVSGSFSAASFDVSTS
jgi:hypothetical protein